MYVALREWDTDALGVESKFYGFHRIEIDAPIGVRTGAGSHRKIDATPYRHSIKAWCLSHGVGGPLYRPAPVLSSPF